MIGLIAFACAAYVSTNIDDLLLLCGFFAHPSYTRRQIVSGQFIGIGILVAISAFCAWATVIIPVPYIGLLGLAPIYLGLTGLLTDRSVHVPPSASRRQTLTVIAATVGDGGDNVATYVPVFAASRLSEGLLVVAIFAAMTALWCWLARAMVAHPVAGRAFRALNERLLPYLLIMIGITVFWRNGTFAVLR